MTRYDEVDRQGEFVGDYRLIQRIGEGGMGEVWLAEQRRGVRREVAIKLIKPGMDSRQVLARFEAERQALSLMNHPNIAGILDAGMTEDGRPFFVMEMVRGRPITEFCDRQRQTTYQRLLLFLQLCRAVQHAHGKGILHRDLKPSNVLVAEREDQPILKVIDFGVAKALSMRLTEETLVTHVGQVIGTPSYMSPEQLDMLELDCRSDVYSLGVVLYELLTGASPLDLKGGRGTSLRKMLEMISEAEPVKPSTKVGQLESSEKERLTRTHQTEVRKLGKILRGDLDRIVMKAIMKERKERYDSVREFHNDVERYLNREPVAAAPVRVRSRPFQRRRYGLIAVSGLGAMLLLLGVWVGIHFSGLHRDTPPQKGANHTGSEPGIRPSREQPDNEIISRPKAAASSESHESSTGSGNEALVEINRETARRLLKDLPPEEGIDVVLDSGDLRGVNAVEYLPDEPFQIQYAYLDATMMGDGEFFELLARMSKLPSLVRFRISAKRRERFDSLSELVHLSNLSLNTNGVDIDYQVLRRFEKLQSVELEGAPSVNAFVDVVSELTKLWRIDINACEWSNQAEVFARLGKHPSLTHLVVGHDNLNDQIWDELAMITQLETIEVWGGQQLTGRGLATLASVPALRTLALKSPALSEVALKEASTLSSLKSLTFRGPLERPWLSHLHEAHFLENLFLYQTGALPHDLGKLIQKLPNCRVVTGE